MCLHQSLMCSPLGWTPPFHQAFSKLVLYEQQRQFLGKKLQEKQPHFVWFMESQQRQHFACVMVVFCRLHPLLRK